MKAENSTPPPNGFWAKLRKHPILTATAGYVTVALAVLQASSLFLGSFDSPHWVLQRLVLIAAIGAVPAALCGWQLHRRDQGLPPIPQAPRSWLLLVLLMVVPAIAVLAFARLHPSVPVQEKSVAVLPFQSQGGDDQNKLICDGIPVEVWANLSKIAGLKVISRSPAEQGRDVQTSTLRETSRKLGAAYVVEGTTERAGNKIHVTASLFDLRTGVERWKQTYDRDVSETFVVPRDIARAVASKIGVDPSPQERSAILARPTADERAYLLYLEAETHWKRLDQTDDLDAWYKNIVELLRKATARDPRFVDAFTLLAQVEANYYRTFDLPPAAGDQVQRDANTVNELRPDSVEAGLAMGYYDFYVRHDSVRAQAEFTDAVQREPNNAAATFCLGLIARRQTRWDDACQLMRTALERDPDNNMFFTLYVHLLAGLHRYDEALTVLDREVTIHPQDPLLHLLKADGLLEWKADARGARMELDKLEPKFNPQGAVTLTRVDCDEFERDFDAARRDLAACSLPELNGMPRELYEGYVAYYRGDITSAKAAFAKALPGLQAQAAQQSPGFDVLVQLAKLYALLGQKDAAAVARSRAEAMIQPDNKIESPAAECDLANALAIDGDLDNAVRRLQAVCGQPFGPHYGRLRAWPGWDSLRKDQRFVGMVASLTPKR